MANVTLDIDLEMVLKGAWDAANLPEEVEILELLKGFLDSYGTNRNRTYYVVTSLDEAKDLVEVLEEK